MPNSFIELLEFRRLLSGIPIDPNFGANGVVAGFDGPISVQSNGKILVDTQSGITRLNPDGSVDATFNSAGVIDTWKEGVALQSDGKLLVLLSGTTLSRHNASGSLDLTFGTGGHFSAFKTTGTTPFVATGIALQGTKIIVLGKIGGVAAMQRLNANGTVDSTFPLVTNINVSDVNVPDIYDYADPLDFVRTSADGTIYVTGSDTANFGGFVGFQGHISRFNSNGTFANTVNIPFPNSGAGGIGPDDVTVLGATVQQDGKLVVVGGYRDLNADASGWFAVRFNANLSVDTTFGSGDGIFSPGKPPFFSDDSVTYVAAGPDGSLILDVNGSLERLLPQAAVGATASISGYLFDDVNGDGKCSLGEPPLAYWQVYADLNDSGVYQAGDPTAFANAQGDFTLTGLAAGTYRIREVPQTGWNPTAPSKTASGDYFTVKLKAGQSVAAGGFGNKPASASIHAPVVTPFAPRNAPASLDFQFAQGGIRDGYGGPIKALPNGQILVDNNGVIHRLNPDGTVDPTFNPAGVIDDFNNTTWTQPGGKIIKFDGAVISRYNANGTLDTTFGTKGHVSTFLTTTLLPTFEPVAIALQGSAIIITGYARNVPDDEFADVIERLTPNGAFDAKFGMVNIHGTHEIYDDIGAPAVARDGDIFVATNTDDNEPEESLNRCNPDGTNIQSLGFGNHMTLPENLAITSSGQVYVAGISFNDEGSTQDFSIDSFNGNTMTNDGETVISGELTINKDGFLHPPPYIAVQADGKILISSNSGIDFNVILRILPLAPPAASITAQINDYGGPIKALPNGQILVDNNGAIHRLNPDGNLDPTFNPAGVIDDFNNTTWTQPGGKTIKFVASNAGGVISRYNANGTLDTTFGTGGHVSTFPGSTGFSKFVPEEIALQGSAIIVAGNAINASGNATVAVERFAPNGAADTKFGLATELKSDYSDYSANLILALAVAPDGHIFIASIFQYSEPQTFLTRFNADGTNSQTITVSNLRAVPTDLATTPANQVIVAGMLQNGLGESFVVDSINGNTMTANGETIIPGDLTVSNAGPNNPYVAVQADGHILLSAANLNVILRIQPLAQPASITGRIYNDLNSDALHEVGEPGLGYWAAYVDVNNSGVYQPGDPIGFADQNGNYQITGLSPGTDIVREIRMDGWSRTQPAGLYPLGFYTIKVAAAKTYPNTDFGNFLNASS